MYNFRISKYGVKLLKMLCMCLVVSIPLLSQAVTTRPKIIGVYASNLSTGVSGIFSSIGDAANVVCQGAWVTGIDHIDGNNIYCKIIIDPKNPATEPIYQGTFPTVDACPGSPQYWAHDDSRVCYDAPEKKPDCDCSGNPVRFGAKEKVQIETDYTSKQGLNFVRYYSSKKFLDGAEIIGLSWGHSYSKRLRTLKPHIYAIDDIDKPTHCRAYSWKGVSGNGGDWYPNEYPPLQDYPVYSTIITRPDGYGYYFASSDGGATWHADSDGKEQLFVLQYDYLGNITQWKLITAENEIEFYDKDGMLTSISYPSGYVQILTYRVGMLEKVTDSFGRELNFTYDDSKHLVAMVDPAGNKYTYTYQGANVLNSVTYPDGLRRIYYYNESLYMGAQLPDSKYLTGIADEISQGNIIRYGTYRYDNKGFPISTEHANGVDKYTFDYYNSSVTDPMGAVRTYSFETVSGRLMQSDITQPDGTGSVASSSTMHDANGNIAFARDFKRTLTVYNYDLTRNLEIRRVEASGTPQARTTTTSWHSTLRLPLQIAEPNRLTTFTYDATGNLLSKTIQATTDTTGSQGLSSTLSGMPRSWAFTYNSLGQVLTVTGPRIDVNDVTHYEYDASGNLITITNAAGHVTRLSNYDANGNVGTITDPNGASTSFTYTPRGWISSRTVSTAGNNETTNFEYDGAGDLIKVTMPDGSTLDYSFDDAHRMTGVSDKLGNSIVYTLDNIGNRISEKVKDMNGGLARQTSRVYDVLSRVKQQTGGVQ